MKQSRSALPFWLGLFLFSIYLLSFSGKLHVMDELAVFTAGNNLAQHSRADINQLIWTNHWTPHPPGIWGQDGNLYTKKAPGISFITAPLLWLGHNLPGLNAVHTGLLTNSIVTALTAALLFIWLTDLSFSRATATFTTLGYGLCTIAWVYARMFWGLSILGLCFLVAVWAARRANEPGFERTSPACAAPGQPPVLQRYFQRDQLWLLVCGIAVALGLTLRFEAGMATVLVGLYLLLGRQEVDDGQGQPLKSSPPSGTGFVRLLPALPQLALYLLPTLIIALGLAYFNLVRYGNLGETGYTQEIVFKEPWIGGFGLLFSPGNGLFLYAPFMLLLFLGLRRAWQRLSRTYFILLTSICLFYWLFYGSWFAWGGTWGWGPRFFLPTLPLLMLFVAGPLERLLATRRDNSSPLTVHGLRFTFCVSARVRRVLAWSGLTVLVVLSLIINLLGIAVDFNEHFLRLGRNDNFIFNWAAFPPLGHWRILQEGLIDIIWLQSGPDGVVIEWPVLRPALILFLMAAVGLYGAYWRMPLLKKLPTQIPVRLVSHPLFLLLVTILTTILTYQVMLGTAGVALASEQARADSPVLEILATSAEPGDVLLVPMLPFGDVQEIAVHIMAYVDRPLPTYAWVESEPRAIRPGEREQLWQVIQSEADQVWLFERWLSQDAPLSLTAAQLTRTAFPVQEQWFEQSGKLTLYALPAATQPPRSIPLDVSFQGGLTLVDFATWGEAVAPGEILKVRLTWQVTAAGQLTGESVPQALPAGGVVGFVHLLAETGQVAQHDRLLLDLQHIEQSPLQPGQTMAQGYGLPVPPDTVPGSYALITGLYLPSSGQRLYRTDGSPDDFLYLTNVIVEQ